MLNCLPILLLLIIYIINVKSQQDFYKHGLFWGGKPFRNSSIHDNGIWQIIDGSSLNFYLPVEKTTLISYDIGIGALRIINGLPLPQETTMDMIQIRCVLDGIPLRYSSSYSSLYDVEQIASTTLSSKFAVNLTAENHAIFLQWKKTGSRIEKWIVSDVDNQYSISVQAEHESINSLIESKDKFLYVVDTWKPLSDILTFYVNYDREVIIGYSFTAQPQLQSFVKDRNMEYIMSRLSIDGTTFEESADLFGTNSWNPSAHVLQGVIKVKLEKGYHSVYIMWRKHGSVFKGWSSSPSFMDGFTNSRNLYVLIEDFESPALYLHERNTLYSGNQWSSVGTKETMLHFDLIKESAVLITYALPVSQYENPNFDSNIWAPLSKIESRLIVDNIAYKYSGEISSSSRKVENLFNSLALVLPAGSHSVNLEWRSDGFNWTILNDFDGGYSHGSNLLVYVSSANSQPSISCPIEIYGYEDVPTIVSNVQISDLDSNLVAGITLELNISVSFGTLSFPNIPLLAKPVIYIHSVDKSMIRMKDTVANINAALNDLMYISPLNWFGEDSLDLSISDEGNIGFNGTPLTAMFTSKVIIQPVDDMFTVNFKPYQHVQNINEGQVLAPIELNDIDAQNSVYRVQLSTTCGVLSLCLSNEQKLLNEVWFFLGDGNNDTAIDFQASFNITQAVLKCIIYTPENVCNRAVHQEVVIFRVIDVVNEMKDLERVISLDVVRENIAPEIVGGDLPRWKLVGLNAVQSNDLNDIALVDYKQYPSLVESSYDLFREQLVAQPYVESSSYSELSVFTTPDSGTYVFSLQFQSFFIKILDSSYLQINTPRMVTLLMMDKLPKKDLTAQCILGSYITMASINFEANTVACNVIYELPSNFEIEWLKLTIFDGDDILTESNYVPLFIVSSLKISSLSIVNILPLSQSIIQVDTNLPGVVDICKFNELSVQAIVYKNFVNCRVPVLNDNISNIDVRLESKNGHFVSNELILNILSVPQLSRAYIVKDLTNGFSSIIVEGSWDFEVFEITLGIYCILGEDNYKFEATQFSEAQIICPLSSSFSNAVSSMGNISIHLLFDNQPTNVISVEQINLNSKQITESYDFIDFYSKTWMETGFITLLGGIQNLISKSRTVIKCSFGADQVTEAIVQDDFTIYCPIPSPALFNYTGELRVNDFLVTNSFDTVLNILKIPVITKIIPDHGFIDGGTVISVSGSGFLQSSGMNCLFDETFVPAIYLTDSQITCTSISHKPGNANFSVIVDGIFAIANSSIKFTYQPTPIITAISPKAGPVEGGINVTVTVIGFEENNLLLCRFGNLTSEAIFSSDEIICLVPFLGFETSVEFALISNSFKVTSASQFRYINPSILIGLYPTYGSISGNDIITIYGTEFIPGTLVTCLFVENTVVARVLNYSAIECISPEVSTAELINVAVAVEGYQLHGTLKFSYINSVKVLSIEPQSGSPLGGTLVTVLGSGFSKISNIHCAFGNVSTPALNMADDYISCITDPNKVGTSQFALYYGESYQIIISTPLIFTFVNPTRILSLNPVASPIQGGAQVLVSGEDFSIFEELDTVSNIHCKFGNSSTVAVILSNTSLSCLSPSYINAEIVNFSLTINEFENFQNILRFEYFNAITLTGIYPNRGSIIGGDTVILSGLSFSLKSEISCLFGDQISNAQIVNLTAIECISPPGGMVGNAIVGISVGGFVIISDELVFMYEPMLSIISFIPENDLDSIASQSILIAGSGFSIDSNLLCMFGNSPTNGIYLNESFISCIVPPYITNEVQLKVIQTIGSSSVVSSSLVYKRSTSVVINSISPSISSLDGGETIFIFGNSFKMSAHFFCQFGELKVPANVETNETISCISPPVTTPGIVAFRVLSYDQDVECIPISFNYVVYAMVLDFEPRSFSTKGGDILIVNGISFIPGSNAYCKFDSIITIGRVLSENKLECRTPISLPGTVNFSVELEGMPLKSFTSTLDFINSVNISSVDVIVGSTVGGTNVTVTGSEFLQTSLIYCVFDKTYVPAIYLSSSLIICTSVPHTVGNVNLRVMTDNVFAVSNSPIIFSYKPSIQLYSLTPEAGVLTGGTQVMVNGVGFLNFGDSLMCYFGMLSNLAIVYNDSLIECTSPPAIIPSLVNFQIKTHGGDVSIGSISFRYLNDIKITSIYPDHGSISGGDVIIFHGIAFPPLSFVRCLFGNLLPTNGLVLSGIAIECQTPFNASVSEEVIGLEIENYRYLSDNIKFSFVENSYLSDVYPQQVSTRGGVNVTLILSRISISSEVLCIFDVHEVAAMQINNTMVICTAPAYPQRLVHFNVKVDGIFAKSDQEFYLQYLNSPLISHISPPTGIVSGNTLVSVFGNNFNILGDSSLCYFGNSTSNAIILSDTEIQCYSPSYFSTGLVDFYLSSSNKREISDGAIYFRYLHPVFIRAVYPVQGSFLGNEIIFLYGANFVTGSATKCIFGSNIGDARVLNSSTIECRTPKISSNDYMLCLNKGNSSNCHNLNYIDTTIGISIDDYSFISDTLSFKFIQQVLVTMISPSYGSTQGGKVITVQGSGFLENLNIFCNFGNKYSRARFISNSMISCITPSNQNNKSVEFSIIAGEVTVVYENSNPMFHYYLMPIVTSLYSSTVPLLTNSVVTIEGINFSNLINLQCKFDDLEVNGTIISSTESYCISPSGLTGNIKYTSLNILSDSDVIYSTKLDVGIEDTPSRVDIYPKVFPVESLSYISILGGMFYERLQYYCSIDESYYTAIPFSSSKLVCVIPPIANEGYLKLSILEENHGVIGNFTIQFILNPVIKSVSSYVSSNIVMLEVEHLNVDLDWRCVYENIEVNALVQSDHEVVCFLPVLPAGMNNESITISLVATKVPLKSNAFVYRTVKDEDMMENDDNFNICFEIPGITSFRNNHLSLFTPKCELRNNKTISFIQKMMIDQKIWFKKQTINPPRLINSISFDYANLPSTSANKDVYHSITDSTYSYSMDTSVTSCSINSNTPCFTADQDVFYNYSTSYFPSSHNLTEDLTINFNAITAIVINTVHPFQLNTENDTWITIEGRGFSNTSLCLINNDTIILTTYVSPFSLQCLVKSLSAYNHLILELTIFDTSSKATSINKVSLIYDLCIEQNLKSFTPITRNTSSTSSSYLTTEHIGNSYCTSESGCNFDTAILSANADYSAFLDIFYLNGAVNLSTTTNYSNSFQIEHRKMQSITFNQSEILEQSELFDMKLEIQKNSNESPRIVLATPLSFDLFNNESYHVLHCYGSGFRNTNEYSLSLSNNSYVTDRIIECYVESQSHLICLIDKIMLPKIYSFDILFQQQVKIFSGKFEFTMNYIENLNQFLDRSNLIDVTTDEYKIITVRPLSGSIEGSTIIAITGKNLISRFQSCTFKFDDYLQYSVLISDTSNNLGYDVIYCKSPVVSKIGLANLLLDIKSGQRLPTGYSFRFFDPPQVSYIFTSNDLDNDEITVFGSNFPIYTQSFCNISFTSGLSLLITAKTISSTEVHCIGAFKQPFYGKVLLSVSISFNGQDFITSDVSVIFTRKQAQSTFNYVSKAAHSPISFGFNDIIQTEIANNLLTINPSSMSFLCDETVNIPVNHLISPQDLEYHCLIDEVIVSKAFYLSSNQMLCTIPPRSPRLYELSVKSSKDLIKVSNTILLQCLLRPKILSGRFISHEDGSLELLFSGLNLDPGLQIQCHIDNFISTASVDSVYEIRCLFNAIDPGMKLVSIRSNGFILSSYQVCLTSNILKAGGTIMNQVKEQNCEDLEFTSFSPKLNVISTKKEIRSFMPRSGLTTGNTAIEIIVDGIDYTSQLVCIFDDVKVDAIVIDLDRVLCSTPPSPPKNSSLLLETSDGYSSWCCGWFLFHPIVKIYSVSPSVIDRVGGNLVQIQSNYLMFNERLYCHFNDDVVPAFIINNSSLSCVSPFIPLVSDVNIAVGSEYEIWSNSFAIAVYSSFAEVAITPKRGSVEGNTSVELLLPQYFLRMTKPVCLFGSIEAIENEKIQSSLNANSFILKCLSPSSFGKRQGSVEVYVKDSEYEISPIFYATTYTFEVPADISSMFPKTVNQGNEVLITILGANFYDSPLMSCLINDNNVLIAQWLSNEVIMCLVPAELSINLDDLEVRVSNNGQDISKHSQILQIIPDNMVVSLEPLSSFSMGNAEITIVFRNKYHGKLYCRFEGSKSIVAFQKDSSTYICLAPKHAPGVISLEIIDSSNFILAIEDFVYYSVPVLSPADEMPIAINDFDNELIFTGMNFALNIVGRFRGDSSSRFVAGFCKYEETISGLKCSKIRTNNVNRFLFLDISINGIDFIKNFATIPVLESSQVVSVDPLYVVSSGNYPLGFTVDKFTSGFSTSCLFKIVVDDLVYNYTTNSSIINNFSGVCYVPKLPLNSIVSWSLFQKEKLIFGDVQLVVVPQPSVSNVSPSMIYTGVLTSIEISFQTAIYTFPNLFCLFQNDSYNLKIINSTFGVCIVNPINAGISKLSLQFENVYEKMEISEISIIDSLMDLKVENNNVLDFAENIVLISSYSCSLQSTYYCSAIGVEVRTLFKSSCEINCLLGKSQNIDHIRLDICSATQCFAPIYSTSLNVISSMSLIALSPAKGQMQGGIDVILYGTGFIQDANLQCSFGNKLVDLIILSSARALCILPPQNNPGFYDVSILRRGLIVSTSIVAFEYLPLLSRFVLESDRISSLGGTVITLRTQKFNNTGPYECHWNEKYTPAFMINETALSCAAPSFDVDVVDFSFSLDKTDITLIQSIYVDKPPSIIFIDPVFFPAYKSVMISIIMEEIIANSNMDIVCKVDGSVVHSTYNNESTLFCYLIEGLYDVGDHIISLEQNLVEFYNLPIFARSSYSIQSINPLTSFEAISTLITIKVTEPMSGSDFSNCCFGDIFTPAILISSSEWQCFSPNKLIYQDNLYTHTSLIGLARSEGFCEYFGFEFSFYKFPSPISISTTFGSVVGGTPITINYKSIIEFSTVYCRIGSKFSLGQIDGNNIHCVSMQSPVGIFDIEISTNGIDFIQTNFKFEYLPILPSSISPAIEINQPEIYFIEPNQVSSISQSMIDIKGAGFRPGAYCELSSSNNSTELSIVLISKYISESEIQCIVPVNKPGIGFISVLNIGSQSTSKLAINFVTDPSIYSTNSKTISPNFGSKTSETLVTIYGNNLNYSSNILLCLINEDWTFAIQVTPSSLQCIVPPSTFSGKITIRIADQNKKFIAGHVLFEYIDDPLLFDVQPSIATYSTDLLLTGIGFLKFSNLTCMLGDIAAETAIISNSKVICRVPALNAGIYSITLTTNGQHYVRSGLSFEYFLQSRINYLWPLNGPALRGGTVLSIYGEGFTDNIDLFCMVDMTMIPAVFKSSSEVQCRLPSHSPGLVNISLIADGALIHPMDQNLQFLYTYDASVDKITPEYGYTSGDFPLFVFGSNFINTTSIGCKFGDMKSRGIFLSNVSILCLTPSPLGLPLLARLDLLAVEVTLNGLDYTDSNITFAYNEPCESGFFCPGSVKQLCPNGTYCPENARNFSLCQPGTFQPQQGQSGCVICPIGYICPDQGMPRPVNCPAGLVCESMGLRVSNILCPGGRYCLNGTKSTSVTDFQIDKSAWSTDYVTGVVTFNVGSQDWSYKDWPLPAVGKSRPMHPPETLCDGLVCAGGTSNFQAEAPFPCPIGHYCRAGAGTQIPVPKNFSTPQRCFDGFFCPRGSPSPEGSGPCPNGYFCPTQLDAIKCPRGHYCPGVGNTAPIECYPGTYNPFEGMANCTVCPSGHICPTWGTLLPELCPSGFVCVSLGLSYPVIQCPAGYWCGEGTLTIDPSAPTLLKPKICRNGQFCLGGVSGILNVEWIPTQPYGGTKPQTCEEGTYCQAGAYLSGGTGLCFKGHYCPPNTTFPIETPKGNFAGDFGSVAPTLCYPGTYAPLFSQVRCDTCPSGHSCLGYGVYVPTVCGVGTTRQSTDSVTCSPCPTGTYAYEVGAPDATLCLPCPPSRICGVKSMISLSQSADCPAGYLCGYGTDISSQFNHLTPAGFHSKPNTIPADQYSSFCAPGYYCPRGTPTYNKFAGKCPVSYFCPRSTPAALNADTKCPMLTSSLSQLDKLQGCQVSAIDVCDKQLVLETQPMEDLTYLDQFSYDLLDDSNGTLSFDSSLSSSSPTGEIQVAQKIYPINTTASSPVWINDTIEAFRACPLYGSGKGGEDIIIIGRNFRDTGSNYCRFRACYYANLGAHPRRCQNQIKSPTGANLPVAGNVSEATYIVRAKFISTTRLSCQTPEYMFEKDTTGNYLFEIDPAVVHYSCQFIDAFGVPKDRGYGNLSYVRDCDVTNLRCKNLPGNNQEYFNSLTLPCTPSEIFNGICANKPELNYMMNPCMSGEAIVEVTNDGVSYTGGDDLAGINIISTVRYADGTKMYDNFKNTTTLSTFAVYTYVYPEYMYDNPEIIEMERRYCNLPRYSQEGYRERENGWFRLNLLEVAHVQINLNAIPNDMIYDQHYRIAIFIVPSRCTIEICSSARVRLSPEEFVPCKKPKELSYWFQQTNVPKNLKNNITIFALDDMLFKVEIQILHGLYVTYAPLFSNSTTVRIASPSRAITMSFEDVQQMLTVNSVNYLPTRTLTQYVSFEQHRVDMQYFFTAIVQQSDSSSVSQPLNLPPLYSDHQRGRALIMNNVSADNTAVPVILDPYGVVNRGTLFWNMPASTSDQSKEQLDAYFETFQQTTWDAVNGYVFQLQTLVLPYFPYFSNCNTFDSYIPIWLFLEGKECALPDDFPESWSRYKFPPLPDQDHQRMVGPFDFFAQPIADWCERSVTCNYEENLPNPDNTPRFFEYGTGSTLFTMIRYPLQYFNYTGRSVTGISKNDGGGGSVYDTLAAISGDNFIPVIIDHSVGDAIPGCLSLCFPRTFDLYIAYYQETVYSKRLIYIQLVGGNYDFNSTNTEYQLNLHYYALGFFDLLMNFSYPISIFMVIFVIIGVLTILIGFIGWLTCRLTTLLQNPPQLKMFSMLALSVPPALAGVVIGVIGIFIMTAAGNYFVNGYFITDPNSPQIAPIGDQLLDIYPLTYNNLLSLSVPALAPPANAKACRTGRTGSIFAIVGIICFVVSAKMFFPKDETKREREIAEKRTELAKKDLWNPILWKKANFMFCSFIIANIIVPLFEFSYSNTFGDAFYTVIVLLIIVGEIMQSMLFIQLNDFILCAPIMCAYSFCTQLVTFGSPNFLAFLLSFFVGVAMQMFQRVFQDTYIDAIYNSGKYIIDGFISMVKSMLPKYLVKKQTVENTENKDFRKREVEGVQETEDEADSVEPILRYYVGVANDCQNLYYFPYLVYLFMQYRNQFVIPINYNIRQSDMLIYMVFQVMIIFFQPFLDVFNHAQCELFHGWKIYEYLVYSRYRFLQRETRWKSMEQSLDECIDESLRRVDQMCFSSQYYLMITVHMNGIIYYILAMQTWINAPFYSPFSDPAFSMIVAYYMFLFAVLKWITLKLASYLKIWKIKHENTAWHLMQREEDDLDIPAWEEIKGASSDAYLMNQRITSETFRYKFLNYNRTWLINQLPQLLTPRTMRRSRPYLINQFARIINARRDDISDDDANEKDKNFGPVALTAPSRNIIRWWLGKARRRIRLRNIVEPLIKRARGAQCEQCLSRKQLQIEYEIDVDKMGDMYDNVYPGDEEVDQVQWKQFWINNQRYHTICLACLTRRKEIDARNAMKGATDPSLFDDGQEDYPDWGPVFLSAASKAMLLNWYRKAQRLRAGKRGNKRQKDRVIKNISDDEGEDLPKDWLKEMPMISGATRAIATKWMRTARARLQKKHGKGAGLREADVLEDVAQVEENFKSGRKSKMLKK